MTQDKKSKMAHVINLISIANLDGKITDEEKDLLFTIAGNLGMTQEEFEFCVKTSNESQGKVIYEVPETDEEKTYYLKNLTAMMMIDGQIDENEKNYIKIVAEKFGYDGDKALEILINSVYEDFRKGLSDNQQGGTTQQNGGDTRQSDKEEGMSEEEFKQETLRLTALGKKALIKHDIRQAFDYLLLPAHVDADAMRLFLMIVNTHTRMHLLSKEQIDTVKNYADKGYALSQYVYGRYLYLMERDDDDFEEAAKYLEAAIKAGIPDALCNLAYMVRDGNYGPVDRAKYMSMTDQAFEQNSMLANRKFCQRYIYGQDGVEANPQFIVDSLKNMFNGNESDDISAINPMFYEMMGDAYGQLHNTDKAEAYYMKAIRMGQIEAYNKYAGLHMDDDDPNIYLTTLSLGCKENDPSSFVYRAAYNMDHYDSYDAATQKQKTAEIKADLETAYELGQDMAPYFLGSAYYYGNYGFEEDNTTAWNWFIRGAHRADSYAYSMLATMIDDGNAPVEVQDGLMEHCQLLALRHGDDDQLRNVVEAYRSGKLTYAAAEIEQYYVPEYEALPEDDDDEEDPEDEDPGEEGEYKLIAIIKPERTADIIEFDVENWDELPAFIDAERLDAIRTKPLYNLSEKVGYKDAHITAWVDRNGLPKNLPINPIGCELYPGDIVGDLILTLEDSRYNPMSFDDLDELKRIVAALGAEVKNVFLEDGPDDDGRYDAWS